MGWKVGGSIYHQKPLVTLVNYKFQPFELWNCELIISSDIIFHFRIYYLGCGKLELNKVKWLNAFGVRTLHFKYFPRQLKLMFSVQSFWYHLLRKLSAILEAEGWTWLLVFQVGFESAVLLSGAECNTHVVNLT